MATSGVKHVPKSRIVILYEDYLAICSHTVTKHGNPHCRAMVLAHFEYLHECRLEAVQQAKQHNEAARRAQVTPTQDTDLWIYESQAQMRGDLLNLFGEKAVEEAYGFLQGQGFLEWRRHPRYRGDQTRQWLFCVDVVQDALDTYAATKQGQKQEENRVPKPASTTPENGLDFEADGDGPIPQKCGIPSPQNCGYPMPQKCGDQHRKIADTNAAELRHSLESIYTDSESIDSESAAESTTEGDTAEMHTATSPSAAAADFSVFMDLVSQLVSLDLNRTDAERLAAQKPEECKRQIEFVRLMDVKEFRSGRGAYLRAAIEGGYGPTGAVAKKLAAQEGRAAQEAETARLQAEADRRREVADARREQLRAFQAGMSPDRVDGLRSEIIAEMRQEPFWNDMLKTNPEGKLVKAEIPRRLELVIAALCDAEGSST